MNGEKLGLLVVLVVLAAWLALVWLLAHAPAERPCPSSEGEILYYGPWERPGAYVVEVDADRRSSSSDGCARRCDACA